MQRKSARERGGGRRRALSVFSQEWRRSVSEVRSEPRRKEKTRRGKTVEESPFENQNDPPRGKIISAALCRALSLVPRDRKRFHRFFARRHEISRREEKNFSKRNVSPRSRGRSPWKKTIRKKFERQGAREHTSDRAVYSTKLMKSNDRQEVLIHFSQRRTAPTRS